MLHPSACLSWCQQRPTYFNCHLFRRRHADVLECSSLAATMLDVLARSLQHPSLWPLAVMDQSPASAVPFREHEAPRCQFQANESAARERLSTHVTHVLWKMLRATVRAGPIARALPSPVIRPNADAAASRTCEFACWSSPANLWQISC